MLRACRYEWDSHRPILEQSGVLSANIVELLRNREWDGNGLDKKHLAVLQYTDAMTIGCIVRDSLFANIKGLFSEREIVEITSTVAAYNT